MDNDKSSGGVVYLDGLCRLLQSLYPEAQIESLYSVEAKKWAARPVRQIVAIIRSMFSDLPAKVIYFRSRKLEEKIRSAFQKNPYDLVFISQAEMLWALDLVPSGTAIVHISQNVEHLLYEQLAKKWSKFSRASEMLRGDTCKYEQFEINGVCRSQGIICISPEDERIFRSRIKNLRSLTLLPQFSYPVAPRRSFADDAIRLGFVANLDWWPNREALDWFVKYVQPGLPKGMTLHCFGRGSESLGKKSPVVGHGFVQDRREVWGSFDVMIAPMLSGGGVNVKVAEAIYNRMPILCRSLALRGLPVEQDQSILIQDTPEGWLQILNGRSIGLLASACGTEHNSSLFSFETGRHRLEGFLSEVRGKHKTLDDGSVGQQQGIARELKVKY